MKNLILIFGLLLMAFLSFGRETKYVNTEQLNIRSGAGATYEIVDNVSKGQKVIIISKQGEWSEVELENKQKGFVSTKFLSDTQNLIAQSSEKKPWIRCLIVIGLVLYVL